MNAPETHVFPRIAEVGGGRPFVWLVAAWNDFAARPTASLFYGGAFVFMGWLLAFAFREAPQYITTLITGFMLLGPALAIGLYDLSRQRERGERPCLLPSLTAWRANPGGLGIFILILTVLFLVWARAALVTFALFESRAMPTWSAFVGELAAFRNVQFLLAFFGIGLIFAVIAFVLSAVSVPFLLDRRTDAVTAALASAVAVVRNPAVMLSWATLIAGLMAVGLLTAFVGLLVTGPLVGHATWHAYRDLVLPEDAPQAMSDPFTSSADSS